MEKIFCIGFSKTDTITLEAALEQLGYKLCKGHYDNNHFHYILSLYLNDEFDEIDRIIGYFDAFGDLTWGGTKFYKYLSEKYPKAKFIHAQRETESWYQSFEKMITQDDKNLVTAIDSFHKSGRYGLIYFIRNVFKVDTLYQNKNILINYYNNYNKEVELYFKNSNYNYLILNIIEGEGWRKLCAFLKKRRAYNLVSSH